MTLYFKIASKVYAEYDGTWSIMADGEKLLCEELNNEIEMVCDYIFRGGLAKALTEAGKPELARRVHIDVRELREPNVWHVLSNMENLVNGESHNISDV
jgi:hypothetical protein